jgi:uncharacterized protein
MMNRMVKIVGTQFVYDGRTGRRYVAGKYILEALRQILELPHPPISVSDGKKLDEAKEIVRRKQAQGHFIDELLRGYRLPNVEERNNPQLKEMILVNTERCNCRCVYCPYSNSSVSSIYRTHSNLDMSPEIVEMALDYFYEYAATDTAIGFYGGEPFLNFPLIQHVVEEIRNNKPDWDGLVTISTNFTVYSREICNFLVKNNILILVSLDGPEHIHDRYRRTASGRKTFKTVNANLTDLKERHPEYYANYVMSNTVLAPPINLDAVETYFSSNKFLFSRFAQAKPSNPNFYPSVGANLSDETSKVEDWALKRLYSFKEHEELHKSPLLYNFCLPWIQDMKNPLIADEEGFRFFKPCIPGSKIMVNSDGSLSICEKCETLKIGHLKTGLDVKKIEAIIFQWQETLGDDCLKCWASGFCEACYLESWDGEKFNRENLIAYCHAFRHRAAKWLETYLTLRKYNPHLFDVLDDIDEKVTR